MPSWNFSSSFHQSIGILSYILNFSKNQTFLFHFAHAKFYLHLFHAHSSYNKWPFSENSCEIFPQFKGFFYGYRLEMVFERVYPWGNEVIDWLADCYDFVYKPIKVQNSFSYILGIQVYLDRLVIFVLRKVNQRPLRSGSLFDYKIPTIISFNGKERMI